MSTPVGDHHFTANDPIKGQITAPTKKGFPRLAERLGLSLKANRYEIDHPLWSGLKVKEFVDRGTLLSNIRKKLYSFQHSAVELKIHGEVRKFYVSQVEKQFLAFLREYTQENKTSLKDLFSRVEAGDLSLPENAFLAGAKQLEGKNADHTLRIGLMVYLIYMEGTLRSGGKGVVEKVVGTAIDPHGRTIERDLPIAMKTMRGDSSSEDLVEELRGNDVLELFHERMGETTEFTGVMKTYGRSDRVILMEHIPGEDGVSGYDGEASFLKKMQGAFKGFQNLLQHRIVYTDGKLDNFIIDEGLYTIIDFGGTAALPTSQEIDNLPIPALSHHLQKYLPEKSLPSTFVFFPYESSNSSDGNFKFSELQVINHLIAHLRDESFGIDSLKSILRLDPKFYEVSPDGMDEIQEKSKLVEIASKSPSISHKTIEEMEDLYREIVRNLTDEIELRYEKFIVFHLAAITAYGLIDLGDWQEQYENSGILKINSEEIIREIGENLEDSEFSSAVKERLSDFLPKMLSLDVSERPTIQEVAEFFLFIKQNELKS